MNIQLSTTVTNSQGDQLMKKKGCGGCALEGGSWGQHITARRCDLSKNTHLVAREKKWEVEETGLLYPPSRASPQPQRPNPTSKTLPLKLTQSPEKPSWGPSCRHGDLWSYVQIQVPVRSYNKQCRQKVLKCQRTLEKRKRFFAI